MATFPVLKTGALVQYPLSVVTRFATEEVYFLDGSRHVFPLQSPLRKWIVRLDQLDPDEMTAVAAFVEAWVGGTFSFTDPGSGSIAPKCVLQGGGVEFQTVEELRSRVQMTIEEVR